MVTWKIYRYLFLAVALCAALGACALIYPKGYNPSNFAPPTSAEPLPLVTASAEISALLRKGGYVIYMRHGLTRYDQLELEKRQRDAGTFSFANCETQRALSHEGHEQLRLAGAAFRKLKLSLERTYSSLYCRAIDSAKYFVDNAIATDRLSNEGQVGLNPENKPRTLAFLSHVPAPGKNIYMMAHGGIFWEATSFTVREGHAVVLDPRNLTLIVARIAPEEWANLVMK
jgi:phosphohistidine phosphatase SixA